MCGNPASGLLDQFELPYLVLLGPLLARELGPFLPAKIGQGNHF